MVNYEFIFKYNLQNKIPLKIWKMLEYKVKGFCFSLEEQIERLFGRVCFYKRKRKRRIVDNKESSLKGVNPLRPRDVKTYKQAERFVKEKITLAKLPKERIYRHPLIYHPYKEW